MSEFGNPQILKKILKCSTLSDWWHYNNTSRVILKKTWYFYSIGLQGRCIVVSAKLFLVPLKSMATNQCVLHPVFQICYAGGRWSCEEDQCGAWWHWADLQSGFQCAVWVVGFLNQTTNSHCKSCTNKAQYRPLQTFSFSQTQMQKSHDISFPQFCQKQNCDVINAHNYDMNGDPKELRSCSVCWSLGVNKLTTESNNDVFCLVHSVGYFVCVLWKYPSTCDEWYKECGLFLDQHLYAQYTIYPAYTQICLQPCFCWSPSHNKDFAVAPHTEMYFHNFF